MKTELAWCEDCQEEVTVYGDLEIGTPWFVEEARDGHEGHDLSALGYSEKVGER